MDGRWSDREAEKGTNLNVHRLQCDGSRQAGTQRVQKMPVFVSNAMRFCQKAPNHQKIVVSCCAFSFIFHYLCISFFKLCVPSSPVFVVSRSQSLVPFGQHTVISNIKGELCVHCTTSRAVYLMCLCSYTNGYKNLYTHTHKAVCCAQAHTHCYYFKSFDLIEKYTKVFPCINLWCVQHCVSEEAILFEAFQEIWYSLSH